MPEQLLLIYVVLPLWWLAGLFDWWLHRRSTIEANSGVRESLLHLLMLVEVAGPVLALLWLEVDAGVLLLCAAGFLMHELTVFADLHWVAGKRYLAPLEQMVHSFQEVLPLAGIILLCAAHWPQALALINLGSEAPIWTLRRKIEPLSLLQIVGVLAGSAAVVALYVEELIRCLRRRPRRSADA